MKICLCSLIARLNKIKLYFIERKSKIPQITQRMNISCCSFNLILRIKKIVTIPKQFWKKRINLEESLHLILVLTISIVYLL
jgi:hypothetical protein